jgi:hypothetical protein
VKRSRFPDVSLEPNAHARNLTAPFSRSPWGSRRLRVCPSDVSQKRPTHGSVIGAAVICAPVPSADDLLGDVPCGRVADPGVGAESSL